MAKMRGRDVTWGELLTGACAGVCGNVYAIRDGAGVVVYVGKARKVEDRLLTHIGRGSFGWIGKSSVGEYITGNLPAARAWVVTVFDVAEDAEDLVIETFNPYFNIMSARRPVPPMKPCPLPRMEGAIANDGVLLD